METDSEDDQYPIDRLVPIQNWILGAPINKSTSSIIKRRLSSWRPMYFKDTDRCLNCESACDYVWVAFVCLEQEGSLLELDKKWFARYICSIKRVGHLRSIISKVKNISKNHINMLAAHVQLNNDYLRIASLRDQQHNGRLYISYQVGLGIKNHFI